MDYSSCRHKSSQNAINDIRIQCTRPSRQEQQRQYRRHCIGRHRGPQRCSAGRRDLPAQVWRTHVGVLWSYGNTADLWAEHSFRFRGDVDCNQSKNSLHWFFWFLFSKMQMFFCWVGKLPPPLTAAILNTATVYRLMSHINLPMLCVQKWLPFNRSINNERLV